MVAVEKENIEKCQAHLESYFQRFFSDHVKFGEYGELCEPLYFDLSEYLGRKGKRIRPLLLYLSYRAMGGDRPIEDDAISRVALSLELLHTFVLIHDDIVDRSEKRRGLPTFHKVVEERIKRYHDKERLSQNVALIVGDLVFALACQTLQMARIHNQSREQIISLFLSYTTDTGWGEIMDIMLSTKDISKVSRQDILKMYHLKTTRYTFEAPCVIGTLMAGSSQDKVKAMQRIAEPMGLAFQIVNDLQEFSHLDSQDALMPSDILEGKKTLLLKETYDRLDPVSRSFLQLCLDGARHTDATILKIQDLIKGSGALDSLKNCSLELFAKSEDEVEKSPLNHEEQTRFKEVIKLIKKQARISI